MTRRAPRTMRWATTTVPICLCLTGCASTTAPIDITVRDALSDQPLAGAIVTAETPTQYHPMDLESIILFKWVGSSERAITDEDGRTQLHVMVDRPARIVVCATGRGTQHAFLDIGLREADASWREMEGESVIDQRLEISVSRP
jgi:hypothetical protein